MAVKQSIWYEPVEVQRGQIWQLGQHRLMCGDSTNSHEVNRLFNGDKFSLCFTSPPYSDQRTYKIGSFDWHSLMIGTFNQIIANGLPDCHILKTWSNPDDIVYEPFSGSGTSLIAAENLSRRCYAMEIEPSYCSLAIQRWQEHTNQKAIQVGGMA